MGVGGIGNTGGVSSFGDQNLPPSDVIINEVFAQLGISVGQLAQTGGYYDPKQINTLVMDLKTIPQSDPNYQTAQTVIGNLQHVLNQQDPQANLTDAFDNLVGISYPGGRPGPSTELLDDQQLVDIGFGFAGLAALNPGSSQGTLVQNSLAFLENIPASSKWYTPSLSAAVTALNKNPPDIAGALTNLANMNPP